MTDEIKHCDCLTKAGELHKSWCTTMLPGVRVDGGSVRTFTTGATRHTDDKKHDYEGFLSPWAMRRYGEYMHLHRIQVDGSKRESDNWQKGIPRSQYMKSLLRHTIDVWSIFRGLFTFDTKDDSEVSIEDALCAVIFNASGLLHEILRRRDYK